MGEIIDFAARKRARVERDKQSAALPAQATNSEKLDVDPFDQLVEELGIKIPTGSSILDDNLVMIGGLGQSFSEYRAKLERNMEADEEGSKTIREAIILMETLVARKRAQAVDAIPNFSREYSMALGDVASDTYRRGLEYESEDLTHVGALLLTRAYGPSRAGRVAENIKIKLKLSQQ